MLKKMAVSTMLAKFCTRMFMRMTKTIISITMTISDRLVFRNVKLLTA